jgi:putative Mg2+ transporter-C (MgtC) family protein
MSLPLQPRDIVVRLALTVLAGCLIGLNRGERGRPAGLRTTLLVCLAASVAMLQANALLGTDGKPSSSFVTLDLMRLPLGILTGVGFIGAGAILRRDNLVLGVTTAATLWFVTVIGLCFGGGQLGLGLAGLVLGLVVLWGLKQVESRLPHEQRATLTLSIASSGPSDRELHARLERAGLQVAAEAFVTEAGAELRELRYELRWHARPSEGAPPPDPVRALADDPAVKRLQWQPLAAPPS